MKQEGRKIRFLGKDGIMADEFWEALGEIESEYEGKYFEILNTLQDEGYRVKSSEFTPENLRNLENDDIKDTINQIEQGSTVKDHYDLIQSYLQGANPDNHQETIGTITVASPLDQEEVTVEVTTYGGLAYHAEITPKNEDIDKEILESQFKQPLQDKAVDEALITL